MTLTKTIRRNLACLVLLDSPRIQDVTPVKNTGLKLLRLLQGILPMTYTEFFQIHQCSHRLSWHPGQRHCVPIFSRLTVGCAYSFFHDFFHCYSTTKWPIVTIHELTKICPKLSENISFCSRVITILQRHQVANCHDFFFT